MPVTSPLHTPALPSVGRTKTRACLASGFMVRGRMGGRRGEETHKDTSFPSPCVVSQCYPFGSWMLSQITATSMETTSYPRSKRIPPLIFLRPVQSATALTKQVTAGEINPKVSPCCNLSRIPAQSWAFFKEADKSHKASFHLNSGNVQQRWK